MGILIVDDDIPLVSNLKDILESEGYAVETAFSGEAALKLGEVGDFSLVLVDIKLPDILGVELIERLGGVCRRADFVVITGYATLDSAVASVENKRIVAYETKPLDLPSLLSLVRQVMNRKQTESRLRKSQERYRLLAENIEDAVWTADENLTITYMSPSGKRRLGMNEEEIRELIKRLLGPEALEKSLSLVRSAITEVLSTGADILRGRTIELEVPLKDGSRIWTETRVSLFWDERGHPVGVLGVSRDRTEQRLTRQALERSEARLLEAQRIAHLGNWEWDLVTGEAFWSEEMIEIYGRGPESRVAPLGCVAFVHPEDSELVQRAIHGALYENHPYSVDYRIVRPDGTERVLHAEGQVTRDSSGKALRMAGTVLDITERKRAENELRALSRRLVEMQETERRSIACELHDQVGQSLTALKMTIEKLRHAPDDSGWSEARSLINDLIGRVRNLSLDLRPSMLDDLGLLPTLLWHFDRYLAQTQIRVNFRHDGLHRTLPLEVCTAAYRIVQEALTNVARHAGVEEVSVLTWIEGDALNVRVEDGGNGFEPSALPAGGSSGLSGMRERAFVLGGRLEVHSAPRKGTNIIAELPLPKVTSGRGEEVDKHSLSR